MSEEESNVDCEKKSDFPSSVKSKLLTKPTLKPFIS